MKNLLIILNTCIALLIAVFPSLCVAQVKGGKTAVPEKQKPALKMKEALVQSGNTPLATFSADETDFVEIDSTSIVNWTDQYVEAVGQAIIDNQRFTVPGQAKLMARQGAIALAQRQLLETVNGVRVEGQTTVEDMKTISVGVNTKVSGLLKGAQIVGGTIYKNGWATVRLRIPLYKRGLAEAVDTTKRGPLPNPNPTDTAGQLQIVVKGDYKPALFPKLTDDQNNLIMDMARAIDPSNGKAPIIMKQTQETLEQLKGKTNIERLEVIQNKFGNLVPLDKTKRLPDWLVTTGKMAWKILKFFIIP